MSNVDRPPPQARLMQALFGFMVTRTVSAVADRAMRLLVSVHPTKSPVSVVE